MSETASAPNARLGVLIVEDEADVCDLLSDAVEDAGLQAECVQSDEAAYAALRAGPAYACMIVDVNLGSGTTGYDVARYARTIQPQLPVIYVSGQTSETSFRAHGVPGGLFIPKPFTPHDLMKRLRVLVGDND